MKTIYAALASSLLWFGPVAAQDQANSWPQYRNERYGFSLHFPSSVFAVEKQSEAGDGQVFVSKDGEARLLVGALKNADALTPSAYQEFIARESYAAYSISYRRGGETWFVMSGEGNGKTFYEKVMFSCSGRLINSFAMLYPTEQRKAYDPIVEKIENSFRPAAQCGAQSAPLAVSRRVPAKAIAKQNKSVARVPGSRSALADRIARERGTDVIVIMRRNGPPYNRKILRGYVSR